jgi:autotransporter-associated beta strand protein
MNAASTHVGDNTLYQGGLKIGNPRALGYGVINLAALNITDRPTFDASSLALPNNILYQSAYVSLSNMANYAGTLSIASGVTLTDAQSIGGTINVLSGATLKMEAGAAVTTLAGQGAVNYRSTSATLQSAPAYTGLLTVQNASTFDVHFAFGGSITAMAVDSAILTLTSGNVDGTITSNQTVKKLGALDFALAGSNSLTGTLSLEGGRLLLRSAGAISGTGPVSFLGGTLVYDYAASNTIDPSARATGAAKVEVSAAAGTATWASVTAATTLEKSGAGTLRVTAQDNFTSVKIYGGALSLGMNGATNGRLFALPSTGKRIEFLGGTLEFREGVSAAVSDYSNYVQSTGTQTFRIGSFGSAINFASAFGDSTDSLIVSGDATGSFVLGAANSWAGIAVGSGKLGLGATGAFGAATTLLTVTGTGIVDFQNRASANPMALNASGKHLTNAANYTGLITVGSTYEPWADERIGGTFQVGTGAKLRMKTGGDVVAITGNGEINYEAGLTGNTSQFVGTLRTLAGATYDMLSDFGGSLDASTYSNSTLKLSAGSLAGNLQAAQLVEKHTAGVVTLNGDATFSGGLSVTGGTLAVSLGVNDNLQVGLAGVSVAAGARMELRTLVAPMTLTSAVNVQTGGAFAKQGSMALDLSGVNTFNGDLELQQGTVALKSAAAIDGSGKIVFAGGTLQYSSLNNVDVSARIDLARSTAIKIDTGNASLVTFAGIGSPTSTGTASLTKSGTTVLSMNGPSYYSGGTVLSAGDLAVSHGQALGAGALTLSAGRLIFQGASALNLQVGGNLTVNSGSMLMMRLADQSSVVPAADVVTMTGGLLFTGTATRTLWLSSLAGGTAPRDVGNGFYKLFQVGASAPAVDLTKFAVTWAGGGPRQQRKEFLFSQNSLNPLEYGIKVQDVTLADLIWVGNPTNLAAPSGNWQEALLGSFRGEDQQFFDLDKVTFDQTSSAKEVFITGAKSVGYRAGLAGVNPAQILITGSSYYKFSGDKGVTADNLKIDVGSQLDLRTTGGAKFKNIELGGNLVLNAGSTLEAPLASGIVFTGGRLVYASSTQDLSGYFASNAGTDFKVQVDAGASSVAFANGMGGVGSTLLKYGAGTLRLSAASSYDGGTTVAEGTLVVAAAAALGSGDVDLTGGDLDVGSRNPFTTNGLATINIRSAASSLANFNGLTNRISVASGVSYDWTTAHQGELQVLGRGKVNLKQSGSIVSLTGNKATDYYSGSFADASAYTGYMNVLGAKTLALTSNFGGSLDVNSGAWLAHGGGVVHSLRGSGVVNYSLGSYADAASFIGLLKVMDGKQFVLNQDFGGSIDSTQSDVTNPANVGLLLNGGILQQNLTAHAVTVNGDVELKGTGNVTGKMTLNAGAFLRLADTIALIPQAGLQIDFKGGVLGMSALYSRDISPYIIETTDRIRINTDGYGQPANVTFASQLKAAGLDKSGDGTLTLMSAISEFRDGEINVLGGTLKAGADDSFGRNRNTGIPGDAKLSRVHVNGATAVLDLNAKRVYNDIFFTAGDIKNASNYHGTISLDNNAQLKLDEPADFNGNIQTQDGNLTLVKGRFVGSINAPGQVSIFSGTPYSSPTKKVVLQGSRATDEIELIGSNNFYIGTNLSSGVDYTGLEILKGTLIVGSLDALGSAGGIDFLDGIIRFKDIGVLHRDISSRITSANAASEANFEVDANAQVTFASGLDSHGMIKLGAGTLEMTGNSMYAFASDKTSVKEGTLLLSGLGSVRGDIIVSAGAKLRLDLDNWAPAVGNNISGAGTVEHANANDLTLAGDSSFTGNITITGGGRLIAGGALYGAQSFGAATGGYVVPGAGATVDFNLKSVVKNVDFRDSTASVINADNYAGTLFVRAGAEFSLAMHERFGGTVNLENGSLHIFDSDGNNRPGAPATELFALKGAGAVDYDGGAIENAAEYTGTLTMRAGTRYNVAQVFGGSFSLSALNSALVLESGSIGGSVSATGSAKVVTKETAETFTLNGNNDLSVGLVINGGKLVLRGVNDIAGGLVINAGILELGHANALGAAGDIVFSPTTVGGTTGWIRYTADSHQDISGRIRINDNSSINIDTNGQNIRFASAVDAGQYWADLVKVGSGDLILSPGANSNYGYSFIQIREGRLVLDSAGALGDPSDPTNQFQIWFDGGRLRHTINNTLSYAGRVIAIDTKDVCIEVDSGASVAYGAGIDGNLSTLRKFGAGSLRIDGDSTIVGQAADLTTSRLGVMVSSWVEEGTLAAGSVGAFGANAIVVGAAGSSNVTRIDLGGFAINQEIFVMNSAAQIKGAHGFVGQVYIPEAVNFTATSTIGSDDGAGTVSTTKLEGLGSTLTIGADTVTPGAHGSVFNVVGNGKISFASGVTGKIATETPGDGALLPSTHYHGGSGDHFSGVIEIQNGANISLNTDLNNTVQLNVGGRLGLAINDVWYVGSSGSSGAQLKVTGGGTIDKNTSGVTTLHGALNNEFTGTYVVSDGILKTADNNALGSGRVIVKGTGQLDMNDKAHELTDVVIVDAPSSLIKAGTWGVGSSSTKYIEFLSTHDDPAARTTAHTSLELPTQADGGFHGKVRVTNGVKVDLSNGFYAPVDYYSGSLEQLSAYDQTLSVFGNLTVSGAFNAHNGSYAALRDDTDANKVVMRAGSVIDFNQLASDKSILTYGGRLQNAANYSGDLVIAAGASLNGIAGNFGGGRIVLFGGSQLDVYAGFANKVLYHGGLLTNGSGYVGELTIDPNKDANWSGFMNVANGVSVGGKIIAPETTSLKVNGFASAVELHGNTVLSGVGSIANLTMRAGAVLKPGNSPGIMNITNSVVLAGGARAVLEFYDVNAVRGVGFDSFDVSGTLDLRQLSPANKFVLNLRSISSVTPDVAGTSLNLGSLAPTDYRDFKIFDYQAGTLLRPIASNIAELFAIDTSAFDIASGITGFYDTDGVSFVAVNRFAIYDNGQGIYLRYGASPLENFATPLTSPLVVNLPAIHVGDPFAIFDLTVTNNQTAPGTTQGLNVTVTSPVQAPATTNGGSVSNLAAGVTDVGSIRVGLQQPTVAGPSQGTVNLTYTSASLDPTSGVPSTVIGHQDIVINGIAYEVAKPVFSGVVSLGSVRRGSTIGNRNFTAQYLAISNAAQSADYGELMNADFQNPATNVIANGSVVGLAPNQASPSALSIYVTTAGEAAGSLVNKTVDLKTTSLAVLGSGLNNTETVTQIQVNGTIYDAAVGNVALADRSINLGVIRVGGTFATRNIAVTNDVVSSAWAETLGASIQPTTANVTANGSFSGLTSGAAANTNLSVTLNATGTAGHVSGTARVSFMTEEVNSSGLGTEAVGYQDITVTGVVHALAKLDTIAPVQNGRVHVGKQFTDVGVRIANDATLSSGYSDDLQVAVSAYDPRLVITGGVARLAPNAVDTTSMTVRIADYLAVGDKSYDFTLASRSLEPTAGLGNIDLADRVVNVQGLVYSGKSTWSGASGAYTDANWSSWTHLGGIPGIDGTFSVGDTATFSGSSAQSIVVTGINPELASITFANAVGTTVSASAGEKFILGTGVALAEIQTQLGANVISAPIDLVQSLRVTTAAGSSVAFDGVVTNTGTATGVEFTGTGVASLATAFAGPKLDFTLSGGTLNSSVDQTFGSGTFTAGTLDAPAATTASPVTINLDSFAKTTSGDLVLGHASDAGALRVALAAGQTATVTAGSLKNNAALQAPLDVSNATLTGVGSSGSLRVLAGATFAPGNSIGRYTVNGNLTLSSGSTLRIEVSPTSATVLSSDVVAASGAAHLGGSLIVSQLGATFPLTSSMYSTIIEHTSFDGAFDSVAFDNATALQYLTLRPKVRSFADHTELYFDVSLPSVDPRTVSSIPSIMGRTNSMFVQAITGDPYSRLAARGPSAAQGITQSSLLSSKDNLNEAVAGAQDNTWVDGYAQTINANQGGGMWGYDYQLGGVAAGIDLIRQPNWVMGLAFGLSQSESKHEFNHDKTSATAYDMGLYTSSVGGDSTASFVAFYSKYNLTHTRYVDMGAATLPATGKPDGFRTGVSFSYDSKLLATSDSRTYLRTGLEAGLMHRDAFREVGNDAIAMNFDAANVPYFQLGLGLGYSTDLFRDQKSWQIFGEGMFTRNVAAGDISTTARFNNRPGPDVSVASPEYTYIQFQPTLGVSWREGHGSAEFKVFAEMRGGKTSPGASVNYRLRF